MIISFVLSELGKDTEEFDDWNGEESVKRASTLRWKS